MQFAIVQYIFVTDNNMYIPNDYIVGASLLRFVYTKDDFKKCMWLNLVILLPFCSAFYLKNKLLSNIFLKIFHIYISILVKKKVLTEGLKF